MNWKNPDWRNPDDYVYPDDATLPRKEFYAWHFLRRNKEYRVDWNRENEEFLKQNQNVPDGLRQIHLDLRLFMIGHSLLNKWHLQRFADPDEPPPALLFRREYGDLIIVKNYRRLYQYPPEEDTDAASMVPANKIAVTFELGLPITPQIKLAQIILIELQNELERIFKIKPIKNIKPRTSNWVDYLRIYDAYQDRSLSLRSRPSKIAAVVYPNDSNIQPDYIASAKVRENYGRACGLIGGGYAKEILV